MEVVAYNSCAVGEGCGLGIRAEYPLVSHLGHGARKLALGGDSMVLQYGPRVQKLSDEGRLAANTYFVTGPACPPVPGLTQRDRWVDCANVTKQPSELVQREKVQTVVLGAAWMDYRSERFLIDRGGLKLSLGTAEGQEAFYANLEDYVRVLQGLGAEVFLVRGVPGNIPVFNPARMVTRGVTGVRVVSDFGETTTIDAMRAVHASSDTQLEIVGAHTGAKLLDVFPDVCGRNNKVCPPLFDEGEPKWGSPAPNIRRPPTLPLLLVDLICTT